MSLYFGKSLIIIILFIGSNLNAQNVLILDNNFKVALIDAGIDVNNDRQIQISEAEACDSLNLKSKDIANLTGIESFVNLTYLNCAYNKIETLNVSPIKYLGILECQFNKLKSLTTGSHQNLNVLYCNNNQINSIDVSKCPSLMYFFCSQNQLTQLDVSKNLKLYQFNCEKNSLSQICVNETQFVDKWGKDKTAKWITNCSSAIDEIMSNNSKVELIGIYDMMGRNVNANQIKEGLHIFYYSDGTFVKRWTSKSF